MGTRTPGEKTFVSYVKTVSLFKSKPYFQKPTGATQKGVNVFTKTAKMTKRSKPLVDQMWKKIKDERLILSSERGPYHLI